MTLEEGGGDTAETEQLLGVAVREVVGATFEVIDGRDKGLALTLTEPSLTIGKGSLATLRLSDPMVSREHLRVELTPSGLVVQDAGSKNGTWLGGVRVCRVTLTVDVTLQIGSTTLAITTSAKPLSVRAFVEDHFGAAVSDSLVMRHLFARLAQAAQTDISVLLEGESGVGKELLARGLHEKSPRRDRPFVPIDCGGIPAELIESELFGHERGAFTGAERAKPGLFEQAHQGTVFLDELGELPIELQPKLLRVLQQREVRRVGGNKAIPIDVRVIAATNRNLKEMCTEGRFRDDLFYRVAELRVRVPSLRERPDDIVLLARSFHRELVGDVNADLPADFLSMLASYPWPGNVRELRNVVSRYALVNIRARNELFDGAIGPRQTGGASADGSEEDLSHLSFGDARKLVLERLERSYFPAVLRRAEGVVSRAAALSGISRSSFYRMLERHTSLRGDDGDDS